MERKLRESLACLAILCAAACGPSGDSSSAAQSTQSGGESNAHISKATSPPVEDGAQRWVIWDGAKAEPLVDDAEIDLYERLSAGHRVYLEFRSAAGVIRNVGLNPSFGYVCTTSPRSTRFEVATRETYDSERHSVRVELDFAEPLNVARQACAADGGAIAGIRGNARAVVVQQLDGDRSSPETITLHSVVVPRPVVAQDANSGEAATQPVQTGVQVRAPIALPAFAPPPDGTRRWVIWSDAGAIPLEDRASINLLPEFNAGRRLYFEIADRDDVIESIRTEAGLSYRCEGGGRPARFEVAWREIYGPERLSARVEMDHTAAFAEAQRACEANGAALGYIGGAVSVSARTQSPRGSIVTYNERVLSSDRTTLQSPPTVADNGGLETLAGPPRYNRWLVVENGAVREIYRSPNGREDSAQADEDLAALFGGGHRLLFEAAITEDPITAIETESPLTYRCANLPHHGQLTIPWRETYGPGRLSVRVEADYAQAYAAAERDCETRGSSLATITGALTGEVMAQTNYGTVRRVSFLLAARPGMPAGLAGANQRDRRERASSTPRPDLSTVRVDWELHAPDGTVTTLDPARPFDMAQIARGGSRLVTRVIIPEATQAGAGVENRVRHIEDVNFVEYRCASVPRLNARGPWPSALTTPGIHAQYPAGNPFQGCPNQDRFLEGEFIVVLGYGLEVSPDTRRVFRIRSTRS